MTSTLSNLSVPEFETTILFFPKCLNGNSLATTLFGLLYNAFGTRLAFDVVYNDCILAGIKLQSNASANATERTGGLLITHCSDIAGSIRYL